MIRIIRFKNVEVKRMGMTDRQFDVHLKAIFRDLEDVREEISEKFQGKSEKLERMLKDLDEQLKRA